MSILGRRATRDDTGRWVEAVVTKCLTDNVTPAQARDFVLGFTLAQILWFWRYPLPEPWGTLSERWEYIAAMKLVYEPGPWVTGDQFDEAFGPYRKSIENALKKNDWATYSALPDEVWEWLVKITGLSREEWEHLPEEADSILTSTVICPACGTDGLLKDVAVVSQPNNPHFVGTRLDVHCVQCGSYLAFDAASRRIRKLSSKWMLAMIVIIVLLLSGLVIWPLVSFLKKAF